MSQDFGPLFLDTNPFEFLIHIVPVSIFAFVSFLQTSPRWPSHEANLSVVVDTAELDLAVSMTENVWVVFFLIQTHLVGPKIYGLKSFCVYSRFKILKLYFKSKKNEKNYWHYGVRHILMYVVIFGCFKKVLLGKSATLEL